MLFKMKWTSCLQKHDYVLIRVKAHSEKKTKNENYHNR